VKVRVAEEAMDASGVPTGLLQTTATRTQVAEQLEVLLVSPPIRLRARGSERREVLVPKEISPVFAAIFLSLKNAAGEPKFCHRGATNCCHMFSWLVLGFILYGIHHPSLVKAGECFEGMNVLVRK
jgi:hypothetical protein